MAEDALDGRGGRAGHREHARRRVAEVVEADLADLGLEQVIVDWAAAPDGVLGRLAVPAPFLPQTCV